MNVVVVAVVVVDVVACAPNCIVSNAILLYCLATALLHCCIVALWHACAYVYVYALDALACVARPHEQCGSVARTRTHTHSSPKVHTHGPHNVTICCAFALFPTHASHLFLLFFLLRLVLPWASHLNLDFLIGFFFNMRAHSKNGEICTFMSFCRRRKHFIFSNCEGVLFYFKGTRFTRRKKFQFES